MSDRARCQPPVKVGLAAEVDALLRQHARPVRRPEPSPEALDLARTLAAIQYGDTPEHVAAMKATNPDWDDTRGMVPLAEGLLGSEWYRRVQRRAVELAYRDHA